jgi:hypothetical protein
MVETQKKKKKEEENGFPTQQKSVYKTILLPIIHLSIHPFIHP